MAGKGHLIFKHGKWFVVLSIPIGDKKYRQKWVQLKAKTEAEAKREQNLLWTDREREEWVEPKKVTVDECYSRWIDHLKNRPKPAGRRTIEEYERIYKNHIKDTFGHVLIQKLTAKQIRELIETKDTQHKARRTYDVLNAIITLAFKDGDVKIKENVCKRLTPPLLEKVKHQTWDAPQCKRFLRGAKHERDYGVFLASMTTGMRIGEVLGLRWQDVDLQKGRIYVNQKLEKKEIGNPEIKVGPPKTEASQNDLLMTGILIEELKKVKKRQDAERDGYKPEHKDHDFVFTNTVGGPVSLEDLRDRVFNKTINRLNESDFVKNKLIEPLPRIRIHDLRHSAATMLLSMKIDIKIIQRYLRHADLSSTLIYTHDDDAELLREATEKMNEALKPTISGKMASNNN
jgi:integrase